MSTDLSNTWQHLNKPTDIFIPQFIPAEIKYKFNNLFAEKSVPGFYRSPDFGNTWQNLNTLSYATFQGYPSDPGFDLNDSRLFATATLNNGGFAIFYSDDLGNHWHNINDSALFNPTMVFQTKCFGDTVFVCSDSGIYASINNGAHWFRFNEGLTDLVVQDILLHNGILYCSTSYSSVWRRPLSELTSIEFTPNKFSLLNIFPNPVHNKLYVQFSENETGKISVQLTNTLGELVYETSADKKSMLTLDVSSLASGIYFLTFKSSTKFETFRVVKQ